jgi:hypothetical protein
MMGTWWKSSGGYINSDQVGLLTTTELGDLTWRIQAFSAGGSSLGDLNGSYASSDDAVAAIAKLTQGFDPSGV